MSGQSAERARGRGCPDIVSDIGHTEAIRSCDAQSGRAGKSSQLLLHIESGFCSALGEPGRYNDSRTRSFAVAFLQYVEYIVVGHNDADQIRRFREIGNAAITGDAHDLVVIRIYRIDRYTVLRSQNRGQKASAVTALRR